MSNRSGRPIQFYLSDASILPCRLYAYRRWTRVEVLGFIFCRLESITNSFDESVRTGLSVGFTEKTGMYAMHSRDDFISDLRNLTLSTAQAVAVLTCCTFAAFETQRFYCPIISTEA